MNAKNTVSMTGAALALAAAGLFASLWLSARAMASRPPPWPSAMLPAVKSASKSVGGGLLQATAAIDRCGVEHAASDNLPRLWLGFTQ